MKNQKGLTLIEILASIVILSLIVLVTANFFIQGAKFSRVSDEKFSDLQIARDVLAVYQAKNDNEVGPQIEIDILATLQVPSDQREYYRGRKAFVSINEHPDRRIKTDVLVIKVVVESNTNGIKNVTELEGYSR